jgi:hypothetical protein
MTMVIAAYFVRCLLQGPGHTNTWRRSLCCTSWLEVSPEILCCIVHAITYGLLTGLREHCVRVMPPCRALRVLNQCRMSRTTTQAACPGMPVLLAPSSATL